MTGHYQRVVAGAFDAESFWAPGNRSGLPVMADEASQKVTLAMEELLFLLCGENDVLLTREGFHPVFREYLSGLGVSFACNSEAFSMAGEGGIPVSHPDRVRGAVLDPFALLPEMERWCARHAVCYRFPSMDCVKEVNSKKYSHELRRDLGLHYGARLVTSARELGACGRDMLEEYGRGVIVKELYGVSGKGNLLLQSPAILDRIVRFVEKQEQRGTITEFLLEPCLDKRADFACAASIGADGSVRILTVQGMKTVGLAYGGSYQMRGERYRAIEKTGYFQHITAACEALARSGYFGDVCFDSMLLHDGSVIPIVEINARKSMTLLKNHLDQKLESFGREALFSYAPLLAQPGFSFAQLLRLLKEEGLLFTKERPEGILPLSANTLNESKAGEGSGSKKKQRGRLYFAAVARTVTETEAYYARMQPILERVKNTAPTCEGGGRVE